jgi:ubiquinone/menaquinone biosynthesis C-methylase UbiE
MPAAYDTYDYLSYWLSRGYEHNSEVLAIRELIGKIKKIKTILEIGAGFGRLVPSYSFRAKKVIISDPSSKLLKIARGTYQGNKKFKFIHGSLETLPEKIRPGSIDLAIMVRVIHHLQDPSIALSTIKRTLIDGGFLILEYPNKRNLKVMIKEFLKGNFTYAADIFRKDLRSPRAKKRGAIPFFNYHPDTIQELLESQGFQIIEKRSVSNLRSSPVKRIFSTDTLLYLEKLLQKPFAQLYLGPSIFILAQKRG